MQHGWAPFSYTLSADIARYLKHPRPREPEKKHRRSSLVLRVKNILESAPHCLCSPTSLFMVQSIFANSTIDYIEGAYCVGCSVAVCFTKFFHQVPKIDCSDRTTKNSALILHPHNSRKPPGWRNTGTFELASQVIRGLKKGDTVDVHPRNEKLRKIYNLKAGFQPAGAAKWFTSFRKERRPHQGLASTRSFAPT